MTIAITSSGISLDGPLVAGEKVAVTVSGLALAAEDKPTLALLARFPDALLASVELAESETAGTWTGELDTATKQTALFFATARADERRDAALELVAGRASLARLTVPMANSALCPKPDGSPFASPVYVPVPGPPGTGVDPYDQPPEMDGEASAGATDEYARGDHRHPTDTSRMAASATGVDIKAGGDVGNVSITAALVGLDEDLGGKQDTISDLATIRSGAAAGATAVQPGALATVATTGDYGDLLNKPTIPSAQIQSDWNQTNSAAVDYIKNKPTSLPNPQPLHVGVMSYDGSAEKYVPNADTIGGYGIVTLESATNSTNETGYAATPLAVKTVADSVAAKATATSLAPAFSSSSTYAVGDYCTHEGLLYKCTTAVTTAGAWNAANWSAVAVTDEMGGGSGNLPYDAEVEYIELDYDSYFDTGISADTIASAYGIFQTPKAGQRFYFGARISTGSGNLAFAFISGYGARWSYGTVTDNKITDTQTTDWHIAGFNGARAFYDGHYLNYTQTGTPASLNAFLGSVNNAGSPILQLDNVSLRIRSFSIVTASGVVRDFTAVRKNGVGCLYDRISGTFFHNVGTGNCFVGPDVNRANNYLFYAPAPSVSGTAATVACEDRAINDFTVATGITSLTITPPAAVTGRARDFFCRVTLTDSSLPTVTLSGATIDIGATEVAGMTQGVNLLMFTEIASGHWLASRRSAS